MGWFDDITGFVKDNKDWLTPVVKTGLGALQQNNVDNTQSQYLDYLRQREQQNFANSQAEINAYNAALAASGSGGGGGNGAARANEASRMAASKKANKAQQNMYKELLAMYAPYRQTADTLLPQMSQTYQNSLGMQNAMAQYLNSPAQVAKLNASVPSWQINVPLPDSVRLK